MGSVQYAMVAPRGTFVPVGTSDPELQLINRALEEEEASFAQHLKAELQPDRLIAEGSC